MRAIIDAIFGTRLPRSRWPGDGAPKKGEIGPSLAAISVRIEGPVNWRRAPAMPGPPCGNHGPSPPRRATQVPADPLLRAIISAKNPLILAPFPQSRWPGAVVRKKGGIKPTLSARTARKAPPVKQRRDVRDFRRTIGESWPVAAWPYDLFSVRKARKGRPISDAIGAGVPLYGLGRRYPRWRIPSPDIIETPPGAEAPFQRNIALNTLREGCFMGRWNFLRRLKCCERRI